MTVTEYADEIVVTTTGGTFTYDGKAHGATVSVSTLPTGYTLETATSDDKVTHVSDGTVTANCDTLVIKNAGGVDVTDKLNINYVNGSIKITPATLTVTTPDASKVYDGTPLTAAGSISGFVNGETATFTTTGSQTEAGNCANTYSLIWNKTAVKSDYTVSETIGTLTVNRANVTVTADNKTKTYGAADPTLTAKVEGLQNGDDKGVITYALSREKGENAGTYTITSSGAEEQGNYNVSYVPGTLTINRASVTVTADAKEKTYGEADPELTATVTGLVGEDNVSYSLSRENGKNVGDYTITPSGVAEQGNYNVSYKTGTFTINKAELTVTANNAGKTFGETDPKLTATVVGLVNEDTTEVLDYVITRSEGEYVGVYPITITENTEPQNYTVTYEGAEFTIVKSGELKIFVNDSSKTYDGTKLESILPTSNVEEGTTFMYSVDDGKTWTEEVPELEGDVEEKLVKVKSVNTNYEEVVKEYVLKINPAELTLAISDVTKVYDGKEAIPDIQLSGLVNSERLPVKITNLESNVTVDENDQPVAVEFTYELGWEKEQPALLRMIMALFSADDEEKSTAKESNYVFTDNIGKYLITPAPLTVTTESATKTFDGIALTAGGSLTGLVEGEEVFFTVTGSQTETGSSTNTYDIVWTDANPKNYTITESLGTLTVTPVPVTPEEPGEPTPGPGDGPTEDPGETTTVTTIPDEATPLAAAGDVLGARRGVEADGGSVLGASRVKAVLGARRGAQTADENAMAMYMAMMGVSASFAGLYTIARRKKRSAKNQ